jgi:hypothetical protein
MTTTTELSQDSSHELSLAPSTACEEAFLLFCQNVAQDLCNKPPYWLKNLNSFKKIFYKYRENGKSHLPIKAFIDANRLVLELPLLSGTDTNDQWLLFPKDAPIPAPKSLGAAKPRGVILPMKEGEHTFCVPISEVYATCIEPETSKRTFHNVSIDTCPAMFLKLLYDMLLEAEPENEALKANMTACEDLLTPCEEPPSLGDTLGSLMNSDGAKNLTTMLQGVMGSVDTTQIQEGFKQFSQNGDMASLFASMGPILQQSGISQLLSGMIPQDPSRPAIQEINPENLD